MMKHCLITYKRLNPVDEKWVFINTVYKGSIADWFLQMQELKHYWCFLNAVEITEEEYNKLDEELG